MKQHFTIFEQIIEVDDEKKEIEIKSFINKYNLNHKITHSISKSEPLWEFFLLLIIANTLIGAMYQNFNDLIYGYILIGIIYFFTYIYSKLKNLTYK